MTLRATVWMVSVLMALSGCGSIGVLGAPVHTSSLNCAFNQKAVVTLNTGTKLLSVPDRICVASNGGVVSWFIRPPFSFPDSCVVLVPTNGGSVGATAGYGDSCVANLAAYSKANVSWTYTLTFFEVDPVKGPIGLWTCDPTIVNRDFGIEPSSTGEKKCTFTPQ